MGNDSTGAGAANPLKPEARLTFFVAGYTLRQAKGMDGFMAFLPEVKPFGDTACAIYIGGGAAADKNVLREGCLTLFPRQAKLTETIVRYMTDNGFLPYIGNGDGDGRGVRVMLAPPEFHPDTKESVAK